MISLLWLIYRLESITFQNEMEDQTYLCGTPRVTFCADWNFSAYSGSELHVSGCWSAWWHCKCSAEALRRSVDHPRPLKNGNNYPGKFYFESKDNQLFTIDAFHKDEVILHGPFLRSGKVAPSAVVVIEQCLILEQLQEGKRRPFGEFTLLAKQFNLNV